MEPPELFRCLESNQQTIVDDAKKLLHQTFNITKEAWLLNGLFDYYLSTNSARAIEILVTVREPHDKYLFDRLCDSLKNSGSKLQALTVLGHVLRRQPAWLYKITQHPLLKDLLKLLKTETDILPLLSALLVIVVLLPMIPALIGPFLQDIFDIFSRLAAWNCNPGRLGEEQLLHLQVAMYALFLRLYGMYPCNFLSYLRNYYRQPGNMPVFIHTVKPMLGNVKIHPHLVTASKDNETESQRWKKMGHHDVIVECERFAVDISGNTGRDDSSCYTGWRSRSSTITASTAADRQQRFDEQLLQSFRYTTNIEKELWSPTFFFQNQHSNSPPPMPEVCTPASIPQTPNSQIPNTQNYVVSSTFPTQEGTSPPEAAIEATPETTPIKDLRSNSRNIQHASIKGSTVARALTTYHNSGKWPNISAASTGSTPSHSQPSSPMRKEPSPFRFPADGSAFQIKSQVREPAVSQKILQIIHDRSQINESPGGVNRGKTPVSPLRVISRDATGSALGSGSIPNSPVPLVDGPGAWPSVARPRPEKNGLPIIPNVDNSSQEDQEVLEIVRQGEMQNVVSRSQLCDSVLQDDAEYEPQDLQQGSPCTSGGLHMPNSHSLQVFATRVNRLRYYSQCGSVPEAGIDISFTNSPKVSEIARVRRANSCPEMKKNYPHSTADSSLGKAALDESDELTIEGQEKTLSNGVVERKLLQRTISTQTLDLWPMPYEHLFLEAFPHMETTVDVRPSPSPSPALCDKNVRFSPYEMLDKYIEQAAYSYEHDGKRTKVHSLESEIKNLREQLGLVHLQLQYERHRREVHAERNRRLLGESRKNKELEEHNSALRDQVALLQKEIEHLNDELNLKKQDFNSREKELQGVVSYWHEQYLYLQEENKSLRTSTDIIERELGATHERLTEETKSHQRTQSELFNLEAEMGVLLERAELVDRLKSQLTQTQKELLIAGELNQKFREKFAEWPLIENRHEESKMLSEAYHEELRNLKHQLETRNAIIESQRAHLQDLDHTNQLRDELCASQKRMLKEIKDCFEEELNAVESKYKSQKAINLCLEERILDLWHRVEVATTRLTAKNAHHSPDTSSCHEAGVTDRTGGTAAVATGSGGLSSPHSSSPLSASLASSEGSMAFLQAAACAPPPLQEVKEIKNLQVIVDQNNEQEMMSSLIDEAAGPSTSFAVPSSSKGAPSSSATTEEINRGILCNQSD